MLRREELASGLAGIGGIVGDQKLVGIAKQIDVAAFEIAKVQPRDALEHCGQAGVFVFHCIAQAVAGGIEIGKQALNVLFRGVAVGRTFDRGEDGRQVGIQAFVRVRTSDDSCKQLTGVDEVALGFDRIFLDRWRDHRVVKLGIVHAFIAALDVVSEVLANEAIKQRAQHILLKVPAIDRAPHIIGNLPDLAP